MFSEEKVKLCFIYLSCRLVQKIKVEFKLLENYLIFLF